MPKSIEARIANKFTINPTAGCHEWTGSLSTQYGYPTISGPGKTVLYVHRHMAGPIPETAPQDGSNRWEVHHKCFNNRCINPEHLQIVTRREHARLHGRLRRAKAQQKRMAARFQQRLVQLRPEQRTELRQRLEDIQTELAALSSSLQKVVTENTARAAQLGREFTY